MQQPPPRLYSLNFTRPKRTNAAFACFATFLTSHGSSEMQMPPARLYSLSFIRPKRTNAAFACVAAFLTSHGCDKTQPPPARWYSLNFTRGTLFGSVRAKRGAPAPRRPTGPAARARRVSSHAARSACTGQTATHRASVRPPKVTKVSLVRAGFLRIPHSLGQTDVIHMATRYSRNGRGVQERGQGPTSAKRITGRGV